MFDAEPTTVTIESPGGSRAAKITSKTATYTFTTDDSLVPGSNISIGISWVSKGGSMGNKIVRLKVVAGGSETTKVNIERWKNLTLVSTFEEDFVNLALSPDGPFLAITKRHGSKFDIIVLKLPTLETVMEVNKEIWEPSLECWGEYPNVAFLPNQQIIVADSLMEKEINYKIYKIPTKEVVKEFKLSLFVKTATTYEGKPILLGYKTCHRPGPLALPSRTFAVSTIDGEMLIHLRSFNPDLIRLSHGGRYYVAVEPHEVRIWKVPDKLIQVFEPTADRGNTSVRSCDVSFDGKYVATLLEEVVKIWETHTIQEVLTHPIYCSLHGGVNFSPDGSLLAVASSSNNMVKILSIPDGTTVTIIEHDRVGYCFFSADANYLITAHKFKNNIKVWKPE